MSKMDLEDRFIRLMKIGMMEDLNLIEMDICCRSCKKHDEIVDGEEWTWVDEKTKVCKECYIDLIKALDEHCPHCNIGCDYCK